jgi:hypothetical protein
VPKFDQLLWKLNFGASHKFFLLRKGPQDVHSKHKHTHTKHKMSVPDHGDWGWGGQRTYDAPGARWIQTMRTIH